MELTKKRLYEEIIGYYESLLTDDRKENTYEKWTDYEIGHVMTSAIENHLRILVQLGETVLNCKPRLKRTRFSTLDPYVKESLLMETAMKICEKYNEDPYKAPAHIQPDSDWVDRYERFRAWAREFEETYYGADEYENGYCKLVSDFVDRKYKEEEKDEDME